MHKMYERHLGWWMCAVSRMTLYAKSHKDAMNKAAETPLSRKIGRPVALNAQITASCPLSSAKFGEFACSYKRKYECEKQQKTTATSTAESGLENKMLLRPFLNGAQFNRRIKMRLQAQLEIGQLIRANHNSYICEHASTVTF